MNKADILKRLALAKYIASKGYSESEKPEPLCSVATLHFHDAIELAFVMGWENLDIVGDINNTQFIKIFTKINEKLQADGKPIISGDVGLKKVTEIRKNFKHHGVIPAKSQLLESAIFTRNFLEEFIKVIFELDIKEVSLIDVVEDQVVKKYLIQAQNNLTSNTAETRKYLALAFEFLLKNYEASKVSLYGKSPFFFGQDMTFLNSFFIGEEVSGRKMGDFIDKVKESIQATQKAVKILAFGFDYRKYIKMRLYLPEPLWGIGMEEPHVALNPDAPFTEDNFNFCLNYIIECALKLQEFDFQIKEEEPHSLEEFF